MISNILLHERNTGKFKKPCISCFCFLLSLFLLINPLHQNHVAFRLLRGHQADTNLNSGQSVCDVFFKEKFLSFVCFISIISLAGKKDPDKPTYQISNKAKTNTDYDFVHEAHISASAYRFVHLLEFERVLLAE